MVSHRVAQRLWLTGHTSAPVGAGALICRNVLLIGEQASDPLNAPEQQPFCDDRGCSGWLNKQLDEGTVPELFLFWVNALNNDGSRVDLSLVLPELRPSLTIALGRTAEKLCQDLNLEYIYVPHPQYWKRFQSKKPYSLIKILKDHFLREWNWN